MSAGAAADVERPRVDPMETGEPSSATSSASSHARHLDAWLWVWWLIGGAVLAATLGLPYVIRPQEARVLETAREMLGAPFEQWMMPQVNGHPRLQKPPLAYWLASGSFKAFGVGEIQGRIPPMLTSWGTLGVTLLVARRLFGARAALLTTAAMLGSFMFFRFARFSETDTLVMGFVTAAVACMWRAFGIESTAVPTTTDPPRRSMLYFHLAAITMALAAMGKGPGAVFPMLFLIGMCAVERRWRPLGRFFISGAPLTFALLAAPWFYYVAHHPQSAALLVDLETSMVRKGWKLPTAYAMPLVQATLPWTVLTVVACIAAVKAWRRDARVRGVVVWALAVLVPLMLWGNKQRHYLLPAIPPMMILLGWQLDMLGRRGKPLSSDADDQREVPPSPLPWRITVIAYAVAALLVPIAGVVADKRLDGIDVVMALLACGAVGLSWLIERRRGLAGGVVALVGANVAMMTFAVTVWGPSLQPVTNRTVADAVAARYGDAPLAFVYREHLPLCWQLRRIIPTAKTDADLATLAAARPGLVAIEVLEKGAPSKTNLMNEAMRFDDRDGNCFVVGLVEPHRAAATQSKGD